MIIAEHPLTNIIPYNKFYPPHIDESQYLIRTPLLSTKLPQDITDKKIILIEAQAGQGKTTLAYQFLNHSDNDYIWYQVGTEDSDPVFLLAALLADLTNKFPDFNSPQLSYIFEQGSIGPQDLFRCANILLRDLDQYLKHDIYITFDDIHLLPSIAITNNLLGYLLDASPSKLHFILISRHPIVLKSKVLRNGMGISYLKTTDLALSSTEIEDLFNNVLDKTISRREAMEIERITGGWIMGIILARHPVSGRGEFWKNSALPVSTSFEHGHMLEYFQDEILSQIPKFLYVPFLRMSIINDIPVDLAVQITGIENMETILVEMAKKNFFVYRLDDTHQVFRFHHFFQEFLQLRADKALTPAEIKEIHTAEAEYYLQKNMLEKALACYGSACDYATMNTILKQQGIQLVEKNRTLTILSLLQTIPEEIILQYSWLTLYAGMLRIDFAPQKLLPYYEAARARFMEEGDETGEIITLAVTIYAHFAISGQFNKGARLLARTEELFKKIGETLPLNVRIIVARNLGVGYNIFVFNMEKAKQYAFLANNLAVRHNVRNFIAYTRFNLSYTLLMSGDFSLSSQEAEKCFSLTNDPLIAFTNRALLRVMHLCYLSMTGDFHNYLRQQRMFEENLDQEVIAQTLAAPYLFVWGCTCYIAKGEIDKAQDLFNRGVDISVTARTEHMQSQLLQWQAFIFSITGDKDQARTVIEESIRLRNIAGGPFFQTFQSILIGAIYTRTGDFEPAAEALAKGVESAVSLPSPYLHACGLLHRSYLRLLSDDRASALQDLRDGLSLMKEHDYKYFWSWEPVMMTRLLSECIAAGIEKEFVTNLARKRLGIALAADGTIIPLLQITLLDNFSISQGKNQLLNIDDFTVSEREMLGLMITTKGQKIDQEKAQLHFWPDSPPEKARKKFDTLLGRLRKKFSERITVPVQNYIVLNKGFLCLENTDTDILQFMDACTAGLAHSRQHEWWQASNYFHQALALWKGNLPADTFTNEYTLSLEIILLETFTEVCLSWGAYLAKTNQLNEAIQLIEKLLLSNTLEEKAVVMLCELYVRNNMPLKVSKIIERYKTALAEIDYTEEEVEKIITEILNGLKKENPEDRRHISALSAALE
jgi:LuxR family transcriptional regulator, maltose regulon positive regulatory protein